MIWVKRENLSETNNVQFLKPAIPSAKVGSTQKQPTLQQQLGTQKTNVVGPYVWFDTNVYFFVIFPLSKNYQLNKFN